MLLHFRSGLLETVLTGFWTGSGVTAAVVETSLTSGIILSEVVGGSEGTGGGLGVEGLLVVCLFEWTPSEKDG